MYKRLLQMLTLLILLSFGMAETAAAQWGIGASYELNFQAADSEPQYGVGIRIERLLGLAVPRMDFRVEGHFAFHKSESVLLYNGNGHQFDYSKDINYFDYDVNFIGRFDYMVDPYAGIGAGFQSYELITGSAESNNISNTEYEDISYSKVRPYVSGIVGVTVDDLPVVRPFAEIRYNYYISDNEIPRSYISDNDALQGRVHAGIAVKF